MNADQTQPKVFDETSGCLAPDVLLAFHRNRLSPPQIKEVIRHLHCCPACAQTSRFVADILQDESRLIQGIEDLLPESKKRPFPSGAGSRRVSTLQAPRVVAAATAVAGMILALFVILVPRQSSPARSVVSARSRQAESTVGSALAAQLFPKRPDLRNRLIRSGILHDTDFGEPPDVLLKANNVKVSFKISAKRDRDDEFYGWSLAIRAESDGSALALLPR